MKQQSARSSLFVLLTVLPLLAACMNGGGDKPSGFLTSYQGFRPGPEGGVDRIWSPPGIDAPGAFARTLSGYDAVLIDPIWISLANREAYDGIEPARLQALADAFEQELRRALTGGYALADRPGAGVLRLSIGLTGVESPSRVLATTSTVLPAGLAISTVSRLVTGEHTNVGSASMELLAADSLSGKALFAAVDRRAGTKGLDNITDPLNAARQAFAFWAGRLRATLDRARLHGL